MAELIIIINTGPYYMQIKNLIWETFRTAENLTFKNIWTIMQ